MSANKPILGPCTKTDDVHLFREQKISLKERGYPNRETKEFVNAYLIKIQEHVKSNFDSKTLLIKVPSGSGMNKITHFFAKAIEEIAGASILPDTLVKKTHKGEAKNNLSLEKRNLDPIGYKIEANEIKEYAKNFSKIVIIDDLIGSGESSIKLAKTLEKEGIKINALFNLVTVEKRYPTPADFNRVKAKLEANAKLLLSDSIKISKDLKFVFGDYTRQKLNRFEREIKNERSALTAIKNLNLAAITEKKFTKGQILKIGIS